MSDPRGEAGLAPKVVVLVLTFRRSERLAGLFSALAAQHRRPDAVHVVDNASGDDTSAIAAQLMAEHRFAGEVITLKRNGGSAEGYHLGLSRILDSEYDWVWFVEDDLVPEPEALDRLVTLVEGGSGSDVAALAAAIVDPNGDILELPRGTCVPRLTGTPCRPIPAREYAAGKPMAIDYFGYLGSMVRLTAIGEAGLPRRDFLGWIDDVEFSWRVTRTGRALLVPSARVLHDDPTPISSFRSGVLARVRRALTEPSFASSWRNAYGLRNLIIWGADAGLVRRRHVLAYSAVFQFRALVGGGSSRRRRARIYREMVRQARMNRPVNVAPRDWAGLETTTSVPAYLAAHSLSYDDEDVERVCTIRAGAS